MQLNQGSPHVPLGKKSTGTCLYQAERKESQKFMKEKVLRCLRNADGYVSGQEICEKLGVSRTAVWKTIRLLEAEGYEISAVKNRGYCLIKAPDSISAGEVREYIKTSWLGREFYSCETVDSTNNWARRLAEEGAAHGTVVAANAQTAGKGRRGRSWLTPAGSTIAMTLLLRPDMPPERASMLTLVEGLSVAQSLQELYGLQAKIKWPNDVVVSGKKVCGILTEMNTQVDYINYIVIGVGINTNLSEFPEELKDKATSLSLELHKEVKRAPIIGKSLEKFEENYEIFRKTWDLSGLTEQYNEILINRDASVKVLEPGHEYMGTARGIDHLGQLLVEKEDGTLQKVYAGEVSVRGLYGYV